MPQIRKSHHFAPPQDTRKGNIRATARLRGDKMKKGSVPQQPHYRSDLGRKRAYPQTLLPISDKSEAFEYHVSGKVTPLPRPRFTSPGGKGRGNAYMPKSVLEKEKNFAIVCKDQNPIIDPLASTTVKIPEAAVRLMVDFEMP